MLRRWLNSILALVLTLTPACAQEFFPNYGPLMDRSVPAPQPTSPTLFPSRSCGTDTANGSTYSTALDFPGLDDTWSAHIVVIAMGEDSQTVFGVNSVSVDGVAMTEVIDEDGTGVVDSALYRTSATQTNASYVTVSVTFSEAVTSSIVCGFALVGFNSITPDSSVQDDDTASGALILTTATTNASGFVVGGCITESATDTATWGVLTEVNSVVHGEGSGSYAKGNATGSSMANTCDWTGTGDASGVAAAFH